MKTIRELLMVGIVCVLGFYSIRWAYNLGYLRGCKVTEATPQTIEQLQNNLLNTGNHRYDPCGVDGKIGTGFKDALKNYSFDQYALKYFDPNFYKDKKCTQ